MSPACGVGDLIEHFCILRHVDESVGIFLIAEVLKMIIDLCWNWVMICKVILLFLFKLVLIDHFKNTPEFYLICKVFSVNMDAPEFNPFH